jgi:hypothetical protein
MYTYGRNTRTHNAILVLLKRLLTLWEVSDARLSPDSILKLVQDDEQIHPVLRNAMKEALSQKKRSAWIVLWNNEEVFNPILQTIMNLGEQQNRSLNQTLRAALSLAAFEEEKLPFSSTYEERYETKKDYDAWLI